MGRHLLLAMLYMFALACGSLSCAAAQSVTFLVSRSPLLGWQNADRVACLGFNGADIKMNARLDYLLTRRLMADTTMTVVDPGTVLRELTRHAYTTGQITDALVLTVGGAVGADVALIGELTPLFTERYGEEKKFRVIETLRPGSGRMVIRLAEEPYWEPYIDQTVVLTAGIRAFDLATGREIGNDRVTHADTLRIMLTAFIENPPEEAVPVDRVSPHLLDRALIGLAARLAERFIPRTVPVARYVKHRIKGGETGLHALAQGDWERAREAWERLVREEPENPDAWNNLAITYELAGRLNDAFEAYGRALVLRPKDRTILRNKGRLVVKHMMR